MTECVEAGARLVNVSAALSDLPSAQGQRLLQRALDYAAHRGAIVVAACDRRGRPLGGSNVCASIGRRGLRAPGSSVTSLCAEGGVVASSGTSVAAPFVTGAIALVWSLFPGATAGQLKEAVTRAHRITRASLVPPLLNAWAIYTTMGTPDVAG